MQFGLDTIMNIPKLETGTVDLNPRTISGEYFWKAGLGDIFNIVLQPHNIILKQIR